MVEMVEILDGRLGKRSVERVRYVINNLLHLVIVKYGDISLVLCISTRLRLVTILSLLVKYLVIFHADPCNKSYWASEASPTLGCSIEISRDIYLCVCRGPKCARRITWPNTRMLKVSLGLKPTSDTLIIHFDYTLEQL